MIKKPEYISGKNHTDARGVISFVNDFHLDLVKRFYIIEPTDIQTVRAWQGHKKEQKWFCVVSGSFSFAVVRLDDWENPSANLEVKEFVLSYNSIGILHIPGGYANGFKAMEPNSKVIVFTDFTVKQSSNDDYRFDQNLWYDWGSN